MSGALRFLSGLIRGEGAAIPWFLPGVAVSALVSLAAGGRLARWLGSHRTVGTLLLFAVGVIVSATLTPGGGNERGIVASGEITCDFSRVGLPPLGMLLDLNDVGLNVALFVPLGLAIALLPRGRRGLAVLLAAIAFPFVIETLQAVVTPLGRGCESADVIDNLLGLGVGLAAGVAMRLLALAGAKRRPARRPGRVVRPD